MPGMAAESVDQWSMGTAIPLGDEFEGNDDTYI
jgi:hypothetical protein